MNKYSENDKTLGAPNNIVGKFSLKSGAIIGGTIFLVTLVIPYFFWEKGWDIRPVVVWGNGIFTSLSVAYTRCFVDTKRGFCKHFFVVFFAFIIGIFMIGYSWLYLHLFI